MSLRTAISDIERYRSARHLPIRLDSEFPTDDRLDEIAAQLDQQHTALLTALDDRDIDAVTRAQVEILEQMFGLALELGTPLNRAWNRTKRSPR